MLGLPFHATVSTAFESVRASSAASQSLIDTTESASSSDATTTAPETFLAVRVTWVLVGSLAVIAVFSAIQYAVAPPVRFGKSTTSDGICTLIALLANAEYWSTRRSTVLDRMSGTNADPVVAPVEPWARASTP